MMHKNGIASQALPLLSLMGVQRSILAIIPSARKEPGDEATCIVLMFKYFSIGIYYCITR